MSVFIVYYGPTYPSGVQNHLVIKITTEKKCKNVHGRIDKVLNYVIHKCREEYGIFDSKSVVKLKFLLVKDSQVKFSSNLAACPWLCLSRSLAQGPVVELNFKGVLSWSHSLGREHSNGDRMHTFTLGLANRRRGLKNALNATVGTPLLASRPLPLLFLLRRKGNAVSDFGHS